MKRVLFLSFYFEPDLCAGSFRNTTLARALSKKIKDYEVEVFTTLPNRYNSYNQTAKSFEKEGNLIIHRLKIPSHKSGLADQVISFASFYYQVIKLTKGQEYSLVYSSSSRLFTAFLGKIVARRNQTKLYLDIRDIFSVNMNSIMKRSLYRLFIIPFLLMVEQFTFKNATHINLISGGFNDYFLKFKKPLKSFYSNGIDDDFIISSDSVIMKEGKQLILYAGNIGEGQGLDKFIPQLAKNFSDKYDFVVIGDGGAKEKLRNKLSELNCINVILKEPIERSQLIEEYNKADFFLLHLNDYEAFKIVLPSKIFELGAMNKPIIAGVGGFAARFMRKNLNNIILVNPCDVETCVKKLKEYKYMRVERTEFIERFQRQKINEEMVSSIAAYL